MWKLKSLTYQQVEMTQILSAGVILSNPDSSPTITLKCAEHEFCSLTYDWYSSRWGPIAIEHYSIFSSLVNPYPVEELEQSSEFELLSDELRSHLSLQFVAPLVYEAFHRMKPLSSETPTWLDRATPMTIQLAFNEQEYEFRALVTEGYIPLFKRARIDTAPLSYKSITQEYSAHLGDISLSAKEFLQLSVADILVFRHIKTNNPTGETINFGDLRLSNCRLSAGGGQYQVTILESKEE